MRHTIARRMRGAAPLLAALALLAGCSGGGGGPVGSPNETRDPIEVARTAADSTLAAGTARFEAVIGFATSATEYSPATSFTGRSTGTFDFGSRLGESETTVGGDGLPETRARDIIDGSVGYTQIEGDSNWYRTDYSQLVNRPVGQFDPAEQLDLLRGVSDDVRVVGQEMLRGTEVRHYAITVDPVRLAETTEVVVPGSITESALSAVEPMPGNVWVDREGRVRKFDVSIVVTGADIELPPEIAGDPAYAEQFADLRNTADVSVEYFDFGVAVTATPPDPALVVDGLPPFALPN